MPACLIPLTSGPLSNCLGSIFTSLSCKQYTCHRTIRIPISAIPPPPSSVQGALLLRRQLTQLGTYFSLLHSQHPVVESCQSILLLESLQNPSSSLLAFYHSLSPGCHLHVSGPFQRPSPCPRSLHFPYTYYMCFNLSMAYFSLLEST